MHKLGYWQIAKQDEWANIFGRWVMTEVDSQLKEIHSEETSTQPPKSPEKKPKKKRKRKKKKKKDEQEEETEDEESEEGEKDEEDANEPTKKRARK